MRGQILGVDPRTGYGVVAGDDGRRYTFEPSDWAQRGEPAVGLHVDFEPSDTRALTIFPVPAAPSAVAAATRPAVVATDRNKYVAALLAFFVGSLGLHRFYTGRTGSGVLMLVMSMTVIGLLVTLPWSLVDTIRYLMMADRDFAARYPRT